MKLALPGAAAALALSLSLSAGAAHAAVAVGVSAGDFTGVTITETDTAGGGQYTIVNASVAAVIYGFGVTNPDSTWAYIGANDGGYGDYTDVGSLTYQGEFTGGEFWGATVLSEADWATFVPAIGQGFALDFTGMTMQDIFGAWAFGTDTVNWYEVADASGLSTGMAADNLYWLTGLPASMAFGVGVDNSLTASYFAPYEIDAGAVVGEEVPLPAAGWMLIAGAGALAGLRRARKA